MKNAIKDYLHLYLGCQVDWKKFPDNESYSRNYRDLGTLACISIHGDVVIETKDSQFHRKLKDVKLVLRPLSDMTKEEANFLDAMAKAQKDGQVKPANCEFVTGIRTTSAEALRVLLSKGFDLFNLIPEGLAIDKADLTVKTLHP